MSNGRVYDAGWCSNPDHYGCYLKAGGVLVHRVRPAADPEAAELTAYLRARREQREGDRRD